MVMREEMLLEEIAESELNKLILDPPKVFNLGMTLGSGDTKPVEGYDGYERTIKWFEFKVPDYNKIQGKEEDDVDAGDAIYKKKIFEEIKKNLEKLIYQVELTVKNKDTGFTYTLSTFVMDPKAKVKIKGF